MTKLEQDIEQIKKQLDSIIRHFNVGEVPYKNLIYIKDKAREKADKIRNVNTEDSRK